MSRRDCCLRWHRLLKASRPAVDFGSLSAAFPYAGGDAGQSWGCASCSFCFLLLAEWAVPACACSQDHELSRAAVPQVGTLLRRGGSGALGDMGAAGDVVETAAGAAEAAVVLDLGSTPAARSPIQTARHNKSATSSTNLFFGGRQSSVMMASVGPHAIRQVLTFMPSRPARAHRVPASSKGVHFGSDEKDTAAHASSTQNKPKVAAGLRHNR